MLHLYCAQIAPSPNEAMKEQSVLLELDTRDIEQRQDLARNVSARKQKRK